MATPEQTNSQQLGQYTLLRRLGGGSTGIVYQAQHQSSGQVVAIKVLSPSVARNPIALTRFKREFAATSQLRHPSIVHALEINQERSLSYLVMEFVDGQSLESRVQTAGKLSEPEALHIVAQIGAALEHAHEHGLIHRDIKPSNILLTTTGDARLTDFGLVKNLEANSSLTETTSVMGTPNYMAPEQFDDARLVDARSDLYALAATLYNAVTGEAPFAARGYLSMVEKKFAGKLAPPRQLNPELSERTERAILRAMSVVPADRPKSCAAFIRELKGLSERSIHPWNPADRFKTMLAWFGWVGRRLWPNTKRETVFRLH